MQLPFIRRRGHYPEPILGAPSFWLPCTESGTSGVLNTTAICDGDPSPSLASRNCVAYTDIIDPATDIVTLVEVSANQMRYACRKSASGLYLGGYLSEPQDENEFLYSQDFTNAAWTKTQCTISANGATAPDGTTTADGIVAAATSAAHLVEQDAGTAAKDNFSVYAKAGAQTWFYMLTESNPNEWTYFDLGNGVIGTEGAGITTAHMYPMGNGWYRCGITYPGAASHAHKFGPAEADNDNVFTGDGSTVDTWVWGAMHSDVGFAYPLSYIATEGATVTRLKDQLRYVGLANLGGVGSNLAGSAAFSVLREDITNATFSVAMQISDGGAAGDKFLMYASAAAQLITSSASGGNAGSVSTASTSDGEVHRLAHSWITDSLWLADDSVILGTDTTVDMPDDLDRIDIGHDAAVANQFKGILSDIKIYPYYTAQPGGL